NVSHLKMAENGGIDNDRYIEDPQSFPQSYSSKDIPVNITDTYNRNHEQTFYLTHRYNVGFDRELEVPDSLMPQPPSETELMKPLGDSLRAVLQEDTLRRAVVIDSLMQQWKQTLVMPTEFVPVTSFIHTFDVERLAHTFLARQLTGNYFTNQYYGNSTDIEDKTRGMSIKNTIGMQLREGFNKWAQMGITLFGTHQLATYTLPLPADTTVMTEHFTEHDLSVGSVLSRRQGKLIHYDVEGELWLLGENLGDFTVDGDMDIDLPLGSKDSLQLALQAYMHSQKPSFYWRHYRNHVTWWDQEDLSRELRTRLMGTLSYPRTKTRLTVGVENLKNYTYFGMKNELRAGADSTSTAPTDYTHDVQALQHGGNVQVFSATLGQDFKLGPLGWENELTYQKSSNQTVLPLPKLSLYTNLYMLFHISKILRVQVGGDMRFFTSYYAPDYAPGVSHFAVQDASFARVKVGNYPIVNVYVNLHLKHCRLYLAMNHVNQGSGRYYWAPHYPVDPRTFHFGVSWNFFN
ncbi:MAG: putative porin, partial [Bacteroidaceae bacterium]|nr:putative porin [Bacteroidaceae bacterium]